MKDGRRDVGNRRNPRPYVATVVRIPNQGKLPYTEVAQITKKMLGDLAIEGGWKSIRQMLKPLRAADIVPTVANTRTVVYTEVFDQLYLTPPESANVYEDGTKSGPVEIEEGITILVSPGIHRKARLKHGVVAYRTSDGRVFAKYEEFLQ